MGKREEKKTDLQKTIGDKEEGWITGERRATEWRGRVEIWKTGTERGKGCNTTMDT